FMEEMGQLHASDLVKNPAQLQTQQIALSEKYELLSDKVNAEFNKQFVANL
ncbi:endonuclease, partial [Enterobacter hormaechei]|nr:endonuclease [Enterobacter hormaechei]